MFVSFICYCLCAMVWSFIAGLDITEKYLRWKAVFDIIIALAFGALTVAIYYMEVH